MNLGAIIHRTESEMAYLCDDHTAQIRLKTEKNDIYTVAIIAGDPYSLRSRPDLVPFYQQPQPMKRIMSDAVYDYWQITVTSDKSRLGYAFIITDQNQQQIILTDKGFIAADDQSMLEDMNTYFRMPFFQVIDRFKGIDWVSKTIWYQIFPERFANGDTTNDPKGTKPWDAIVNPKWDDYYGGDLQGVLDHLDHLVDLGVNGIYFNPVFKAPSNHKYDTENYYEIDPDFGDKELFKQVVNAAHTRGIKIMLDAVFNHIGDKSPIWQDVIKNGASSKYADWFHVHDFPVHYTPTDNFEFAVDANYDTFDYTPHMPKLNTANRQVQDYLLNIAKYWVTEFDIDAWRLDVANEIDHHFWRRFHDELQQIKPDFYILGEIWHNSQAWLNGDEFTGVMNYTYTGAIIDHFINHHLNQTALLETLSSQLMLYRDATNAMMFNALDSHDTPRIKTLSHDNMDLVKQMFAFTFMQPGVPSIYYGTEYGMTGENDPDNRKPMVWETQLQDQDMYQTMQQLIIFRKQFATIFAKGSLEFGTENGMLWIQRDDIVGYFNTSQHQQKLDVTTDEVLLSNNFIDGTLLTDGFVICRQTI